MSKIKKISTLLVIFMIGIITLYTISKAATYSAEMLNNNMDGVSCVQHGVPMKSIFGNITYQEIPASISREMSYTLGWLRHKQIETGQSNYGYFDGEGGAVYTTYQKAIYTLISNGSLNPGVSTASDNYAGDAEVQAWMAEGSEHARIAMGMNLSDYILGDLQSGQPNNESIQQQSSDDNVTVSVVGEKTIEVGPFCYTFPPNIAEFKVYGKTYENNEEEITQFQVWRVNGTQKEQIGRSEIKSGDVIYLSFQQDYLLQGKFKTLSKIHIKVSPPLYQVYTASVTGWESQDVYWDEYYTNPDGTTGFITHSAKPQNLMKADITTINVPDLEKDFGGKKIPLMANIAIEKVNQDKPSYKLNNVVFKIRYNNPMGAEQQYYYLRRNSDGTVSYVTENEATEFSTNVDGKIELKNIFPGSYTAIEVNNPHYGYEIIVATTERQVKAGNNSNWVIENKQKYVKVSGYIWEDLVYGKDSGQKNDLAYDEAADKEDTADKLNELALADNSGKYMNVRLKNKYDNSTIKETKARYVRKTVNGINASYFEYLFLEVETDYLANYYVEFEYNGLLYTNVQTTYLVSAIEHTDSPNEITNKENGSKAKENAQIRLQFENSFSQLYGVSDTAVRTTPNASGNQIYTANYTKQQPYTADLATNMGEFLMYANTQEVQDGMLRKAFDWGAIEEIKHINLGLDRREQADLALMQDLKDIKLEINGYGNTYSYNRRYSDNMAGETPWNMGIRFEDTLYNMGYARPIYKADAHYTNADNPDSELKAYLTYKIELANQSAIMDGQVNSFIDYFDGRYELVGAKFENGANLNYAVDNSFNQNGFKKAIITTNVDKNNNTIGSITTGSSQIVEVTFKLDRETIETMLGKEELLQNFVEINNYTSYYAGTRNIRSAVDKNSIPGNAIPTSNDVSHTDIRKLYENDTDLAKPVKLTIAEARKIDGVVFKDNTSTNAQNERHGNSYYEDGEEKIRNVKVQLIQLDKNGNEVGVADIYDDDEWKAAEYLKTKDDGTYHFEGYIPGKYKIRFYWGDGYTNEQDINVQDNKGTDYNTQEISNRYDLNSNNLTWYRDQTDTAKRYTDALDDWGTRVNIDDQMTDLTYQNSVEVRDRSRAVEEGEIITVMPSTTLAMEFSIEYHPTYTDGLGEDGDGNYTFKVQDVDFGIADRAKQEISLTKEITGFRVSLGSGSPIIDAYINNGVMTGQTDYVTYIRNNFIKAEMDNEILQDAKAQIEYTLTVTNNSEVDYHSQSYYLLGNLGRDNIITITPVCIIDYVDNLASLDTTTGTPNDWTKIQDVSILTKKDTENGYEMKDELLSNLNLLNNKNIYVTTSLKNAPVQPNGGTQKITFHAIQSLGTNDETNVNNQAEIIHITRVGGKMFEENLTPGNYLPNGNEQEEDDTRSEVSTIIPSTGEDKNYTIPVIIGTLGLLILGVGAYFINKKVLGKGK